MMAPNYLLIYETHAILPCSGEAISRYFGRLFARRVGFLRVILPSSGAIIHVGMLRSYGIASPGLGFSGPTCDDGVELFADTRNSHHFCGLVMQF